MINIKNASEIEKMKRAGRVVALAHQAAKEAIRPGITTKELDEKIRKVIVANGAIPSFKDYNGYPANACVSVNNVVIHGIPSGYKLCEGDIVSFDIGAVVDGFHGDAAATHGVGEISQEAQNLIDVTQASFFEGIKYATEGNRLSDISIAIQQFVEAKGYSVVKDFVGHGIGRNLHEDPEVPNYYTGRRGTRLYAGMALAIEPMINVGDDEVEVLEDGWTVVTADGSLSAHYENTIIITKNEPIITTLL
ncbi:MAG: type I methionyl aminopeptidase [Eubacteriales bacterium]|nr:type I methionyl aminopeptidase [Eubacteriales bacterium]